MSDEGTDLTRRSLLAAAAGAGVAGTAGCSGVQTPSDVAAAASVEGNVGYFRGPTQVDPGESIFVDARSMAQYRADHVPWSMYFKKGYALHGTYWHDGFGHPRSHGCINLAPKDAMFVYHFTCPKVPKGWTSLYADEDHPGTLIRIRGTRSEKEKKILEQRDEKEKPRDQ